MQKFEYKSRAYTPKGIMGGKVDTDAFDAILNEMSYEGFELFKTERVSSDGGSTRSLLCIFRRPRA